MAASKAEPNIIPLCDVLLVLLIIFMIITPLIQKGLDVRLPGVNGKGDGPIVVTLRPDNKALINQEEIEISKLQDRLRSIYAFRQDKTIFIRAYASVPYQRVVELLDIINGAGLKQLGLIPEYIKDGI